MATIDLKNELGLLSWKFISHSFRIFAQLHSELANDCGNGKGKVQKRLLEQCSQRFRIAILEKFADELKLVINNLESLQLPSACIALFDNLLDKIYSVEQFWHLCELFLFGTEDNLLIESISWLKVLITEYNTENLLLRYSSLIVENEVYESRDQRAASISNLLAQNGYWDIIYGLALQGSLDSLWVLLELHPDIQELGNLSSNCDTTSKSILADLKHIFASYPYSAHLAVGNSTPTPANCSERLLGVSLKSWKESIVTIRERLLFNNKGMHFAHCSVELVENVLGILSGNVKVLQSRCDSWVELSLSMILFVYNTSAKFTFGTFSGIINESMNIFKAHENDERYLCVFMLLGCMYNCTCCVVN